MEIIKKEIVRVAVVFNHSVLEEKSRAIFFFINYNFDSVFFLLRYRQIYSEIHFLSLIFRKMNENYQPRGGATINNGPTKGGTTANNRNGNNRNKYKNNNSNNNNKGANTNSNQNHQRQNSNFANNSDANLKPTPQYNNSQNSNHLNSFNDFSASCSNPPYNLGKY